MIKWNGYTIEKVELEKAKRQELFSGVHSTSVTDLPEEIKDLPVGYYRINEVESYFEIDDGMVKYGGEKSVLFPLWKKNVVYDYLRSIWEREGQEQEGEIMAEVIVFNNDLHIEPIFVDGVATLKNYYNKSIQIKDVTKEYEVDNDDKFYELIVNGRLEVDIHNITGEGFSAFDGVDGYGWHETLKQAVKRYMDSTHRYSYDGEVYEVSCSSCGDGGCYHCEPNRFI